METINKKYPYKASMSRKNWTPGVNHWLNETVGRGYFQYRKPQDAYRYLQYAFVREEDATAFSLRFK